MNLQKREEGSLCYSICRWKNFQLYSLLFRTEKMAVISSKEEGSTQVTRTYEEASNKQKNDMFCNQVTKCYS